jgi:hypothetical protein
LCRITPRGIALLLVGCALAAQRLADQEPEINMLISGSEAGLSSQF